MFMLYILFRFPSSISATNHPTRIWRSSPWSVKGEGPLKQISCLSPIVEHIGGRDSVLGTSQSGTVSAIGNSRSRTASQDGSHRRKYFYLGKFANSRQLNWSVNNWWDSQPSKAYWQLLTKPNYFPALSKSQLATSLWALMIWKIKMWMTSQRVISIFISQYLINKDWWTMIFCQNIQWEVDNH